MTRQRKPVDYNKLRDKWYAKLAKEGFEDIEDTEGRLKTYASSALVQVYKDHLKYDTKERYYQLAGQFLHDHKFKSNVERFIWEQHCEGVSIRKMVKEINKKGNKIYRRLVHEMLQQLRSEMIIKTKGGSKK